MSYLLVYSVCYSYVRTSLILLVWLLIQGVFSTKRRRRWIRISWRLTKRLSEGLRFIDSHGLFCETKTPLISHLHALRNAVTRFLNCLYLNGHKKIKVFVFRSPVSGLRSSVTQFCQARHEFQNYNTLFSNIMWHFFRFTIFINSVVHHQFQRVGNHFFNSPFGL